MITNERKNMYTNIIAHLKSSPSDGRITTTRNRVLPNLQRVRHASSFNQTSETPNILVSRHALGSEIT